MVQKSFLIADSPICGKDQVISGTILYPWQECMIADELKTHNDKVIADALSLAKEFEFSNIREVECYYKEVYHNKWRMVEHKLVRTKEVPFKQ